MSLLNIQEKVLILVLVEDGLRVKPWVICDSLDEVLILVLVEDGLRARLSTAD